MSDSDTTDDASTTASTGGATSSLSATGTNTTVAGTTMVTSTTTDADTTSSSEELTDGTTASAACMCDGTSGDGERCPSECVSGEGSGESGTPGASDSEGSSSSGVSLCNRDEECSGDAPFCDIARSECVGCNALPEDERDAACQARDAGLPICVEDTCVACTADDLGACSDVCDAVTNTCMDCTTHAQCPAPASACHLAPGPRQGTCFPADAVLNVGTGQEFSTVTAALDALPAGEVSVVLLHSQVVDEAVLIDGERVVLVRASSPQVGDLDWELDSVYQYELGGLIAVHESTLYLDRIDIFARANNPSMVLGVYDGVLFVEGSSVACSVGHQYGMGVGLRAQRSEATVVDTVVQVGGGTPVGTRRGIEVLEGSTLRLSRSRVRSQTEGIWVSDSTAVLENSFVVGELETLSLRENARADVLYSTLGNGGSRFIGSGAVVCDDSSSAILRNSIAINSRGDNAPVDCSVVITTSQLVSETQFDPLWFEDYENGDFHLRLEHPFSDAAVWRAGDPVTDIDGDARPTVDGAPDIVGADVR